MNGIVWIYLASILAGYALLHLPATTFLSSLAPFFDIVGVIAIIVFSFVLLYTGVKTLFNRQ
jgi:amino acid transporter